MIFLFCWVLTEGLDSLVFYLQSTVSSCSSTSEEDTSLFIFIFNSAYISPSFFKSAKCHFVNIVTKTLVCSFHTFGTKPSLLAVLQSHQSSLWFFFFQNCQPSIHQASRFGGVHCKKWSRRCLFTLLWKLVTFHQPLKLRARRGQESVSPGCCHRSLCSWRNWRRD